MPLCAAVALMAGCSSDPLTVDTIQLGRTLNPDNSVGEHATTFNPSDTIYVSVLTPAAGAGTISVRWTYQGSLIAEPSKEVSFNGPGATAFPLVNSGGFPSGSYSVEVFLDGVSVGTRNFNIAR